MEQKVILLTGSSRGLGKATAIALAKENHKVYATMRNPSVVTDFDDVPNITLQQLDVTDNASIEAAVAEIIENEKRIDVVINNAGYALFSPVEMATERETFDQFNVNVFGVLRVMQRVLPQMRQQKSGHIINISSIAGIVSNPGLGIYCATKHAIEAISASLASTVFPWNIKVTVVQPGPTATNFFESMAIGSRLQESNPYEAFAKRYQERFSKIIQEGQPPEEVAELIASIIRMENPDFRYQTSPRLEELATRFVTDPTGNIWVNEQKENFSDWF
ncbi:MAG: 3-oxoacyl-[acyl-carrier-protein] reductase FabG [Chlamydiae bacterium]|nr:3-oxoacyl-[acyl-carrier-protein] reductase FabG [Chlamydiota bacterium]